MLGILCRVSGSVSGGIIMFALWLSAVLIRMPRPPVPPSFALTLTAPVVTAVGFALGLLVVERLTHRRHGVLREAFLWEQQPCSFGKCSYTGMEAPPHNRMQLPKLAAVRTLQAEVAACARASGRDRRIASQLIRRVLRSGRSPPVRPRQADTTFCGQSRRAPFPC